MGVSFDFNQKKWKVSISIDSKTISHYYIKEIHAAHQYNLWLEEFNCIGGKPNIINIPEDFVKWESKNIDKKLPKGITVRNGRFRVSLMIDKKIVIDRSYTSLEEAISVIYDKKKEIEESKNIEEPIVRNDEGQCIIKKGGFEFIVDEDIYKKIYKMGLYAQKNGRIAIYISGKRHVLSRYILNYDGEHFIDHINRNPLDNRRDNLRIATVGQNNFNKTKQQGCISQYIGISKTFNCITNKWYAHIMCKGEYYHLGVFKTEEEAARARDIATKKYFGEFGSYNFPDELKLN